MKKSLIAVALLLGIVLPATAQSQSLKIGYANVDYIVSQLPDSKQIESELKAHNKQLENQLKAKYQEYQKKAEAYQKGAATMTDAVRADRERELTTLQNSIAQFERDAQFELQQKQQQLLQPVYEKVQKAIDAVAGEQGYTHVFSPNASGSPILLYACDQDNISDLVLQKMGVTAPANN